ncbi:hypothetical protein THIAE_08655 [Thiomicrospira aerophila AL3]|uniref:Outer membrane protein beta-barrel domain-containing protein n=1 Tax=Thiomicrospira aerophila AL3 TaxID=717772 RepID=W0DZF1_9GAMM|nr:outer membrane beta-barrel protein [Thiomicrospira aerophila]AHF02364.1 hypothetical protein THIAE_08655 [Thiomicrospira aerophila AL3]
MKTRFKLKKLTLATLLAVPVTAFAGSPMNVDDAGILDHKSCHVEAWVDNYSKANEIWVAPACNLNGHWELGFALGHANFDDADSFNLYGLNAKTMLTEQDGWAVALSLGVVLADKIEHDQAVYTLLAPISFNLLDDQLDLHLNLGLSRDQTLKKDFALWGIGAEYHFTDSVRGYVEAFGNTESGDHETRGYQFGAAFNVTDKWQLDISYGDSLKDADNETNYVRLGFVYETASWLK